MTFDGISINGDAVIVFGLNFWYNQTRMSWK